MVRTLLVRGMLVGLVAGALALIVARVLGEPQVGAAIALEATGSHEHETELFSRAVQAGIGLATGIGVYALALGGLFAMAYAVAQGRLGSVGARGTSALVALGAFIAVVLVPFVKYPANPPAVGNGDTIGSRTVLYFALIAASLLCAGAAIRVGRASVARLGTWNATLLGVATYLAAITVVMIILPDVDEVRRSDRAQPGRPPPGAGRRRAQRGLAPRNTRAFAGSPGPGADAVEQCRRLAGMHDAEPARRARHGDVQVLRAPW
jgi:hypothetical protein